jgi:hypothetical protein
MSAGSRLSPAERPCIVQGCAEPRYVSPSGYVDTRCRMHEAEDARRRYVASRTSTRPYVRSAGPKHSRPCLGALVWDDQLQRPVVDPTPCPNPRRVNVSGTVDGRCQQHAAQAQLLWHGGRPGR